ncbi:MAG: DNA alkylation repair protein [Chthoniobacteraceae bacterium]
MNSAAEAILHLESIRDDSTAAFLQGYFQTAPGGYGEGDRFLGIRVPVLRKLAPAAAQFPLPEQRRLLRSPWHEARLLALLALVRAYQRGDKPLRARIHALYLSHTRWINNWDLVDTSAEHLVGAHVRNGHAPASILDPLAVSESVWERRIAILAMFHFIRHDDFELPLRLLAGTLDDPHPLIHKPAGWMLREIGKRDCSPLIAFLEVHASTMPRTMLRYAIERLPKRQRRHYLTMR